MDRQELAKIVAKLGGQRATARRVGCSQTAIRRYLLGWRTTPPALAEVLRRAAQEVSTPPETEPRRVSEVVPVVEAVAVTTSAGKVA